MKQGRPRWVRGAHRIAAIWLLVALLGLPAAPPAARSAPAGASFTAGQALANATHLAGVIGARAAGTPGEVAAGDWIAAQFDAMGYAVTRQPFQILRFALPYTATNIIAVKPGASGYGTIYVGAHYDTVFPIEGSERHGPGANDNASGVGVLLEAARVLAGAPISQTVQFIAFSAEEDGLVGSYYFVGKMTLAERLTAEGMINLDCVGIGSQFEILVAKKEHLPFAHALKVVADTIEVWPVAGSDHAPFAGAGIPAAFFYINPDDPKPCGPDYHSVGDTPDKLEEAAVARTGEALVAALHNLAAAAEPRIVHYTYIPAVARQLRSGTRSH